MKSAPDCDHATGGIEFPGHAQAPVDHAGNVVAAEGNSAVRETIGEFERVVPERIETCGREIKRRQTAKIVSHRHGERFASGRLPAEEVVPVPAHVDAGEKVVAVSEFRMAAVVKSGA